MGVPSLSHVVALAHDARDPYSMARFARAARRYAASLPLPPERVSRMLALSDRAAVIGARTGLEAEWLRGAAALLRIGDADPVSGVPAVDAARVLRREFAPHRVTRAVAWHAWAEGQASRLGLRGELERIGMPELLDHAVLWAAEVTTGADGAVVEPDVRLAQLRESGEVPGQLLDRAQARLVWELQLAGL